MKKRKNYKAIYTALLAVISLCFILSCSASVDVGKVLVYTLFVMGGEHGSTQPAGSIRANHGDPVAIAAVPDSTYYFINWSVLSGSGVDFTNSQAASTTVRLTGGDAIIQANFAQNVLQLTILDDGNGDTDPSGNVLVISGISTDIAADAEEGYAFVQWSALSGDAVLFEDENAAETAVTIAISNAVIIATFAEIPVAAFTSDKTQGPLPLDVQFTDNSTGDIDTWEWDFGDGGEHSFAQHPLHQYTSAGYYTVGLTVSGPGGGDTLEKQELIAAGDLPAADFSGNPLSGDDSLFVVFTDSSTGDIDTWEWDFGDGSSLTYDKDTHEEIFDHEYTDPGVYTVSLSVSGALGSHSRTREDYIVVGQPPDASFHPDPDSGSPPLEVTFNEYSSGDIDTWEWDFGDGSAHSYVQSPAHTYDTPGYYTVSLTVTGPAGTDALIEEDCIRVNGWGPVGEAGFSSGEASYTDLRFDAGGTPYVAYADAGYGNRVVVMKYTGGGATGWEPTGSLGISSGAAEYVKLAVSGGTPADIYVAYSDVESSNKATVLKYTGGGATGWDPLGTEGGVTGYGVQHIDLDIRSGAPYLSYTSRSYWDETVVIYYSSGWKSAGEVSEFGEGRHLNFDVDSANDMYLVWEQQNGEILCKKYYEYLGWEDWYPFGCGEYCNPEFEDPDGVVGDGTYVGFEIDSDQDILYVAFSDAGRSDEASGRKCDPATAEPPDQPEYALWEDVGTSGFSDGDAEYMSLCLDSAGRPVVAYSDAVRDDKLTVMRCSGSDWYQYSSGSEGCTVGAVSYVSLRWNPVKNVPYVAFVHAADGNKVTVLRYFF